MSTESLSSDSVGCKAARHPSCAPGLTNAGSELLFKPLPETFTKHGFQFVQIVREGDLAIYCKTKGRWRGYEVIRIRRHKGYTVGGKQVEPAEVYPGNEKWGVDGFSCASRTDAHIRMAKMASLKVTAGTL